MSLREENLPENLVYYLHVAEQERSQAGSRMKAAVNVRLAKIRTATPAEPSPHEVPPNQEAAATKATSKTGQP